MVTIRTLAENVSKFVGKLEKCAEDCLVSIVAEKRDCNVNWPPSAVICPELVSRLKLKMFFNSFFVYSNLIIEF
jgi:hypothetical protein